MTSATPTVNLDHARTDTQRAVMEQIIKDGVCPFCREHLEHYHSKPILFETTHWIATTNFVPYGGTRHHFLLIAQTHVEQLSSISPAAQTDLFAVIARLHTEYDIPGSTLLIRSGNTEYTGGSVTHLHAQLIVGAARTEGGVAILTSVGYQDPSITR
jgi:ATP adenylyltransferase